MFVLCSTIINEQAQTTRRTMARTTNVLDHLATHVATNTRFHSSVILIMFRCIISAGTKIKKHTSRIFFFGVAPRKSERIKMNNNIFVSCGVVCIVVCSTAEVEFKALF